MTEEKNLLLIDLCSRLPYGVKVEAETWLEDEGEFAYVPDKVYSINSDGYIVHGYDEVYECKPYLFPMSSMTDEQKNVYHSFYVDILRGLITPDNSIKMIDWLNKNHFDYRGLIEKGLAIDATGLNIY
jgi:hypothetical protein